MRQRIALIAVAALLPVAAPAVATAGNRCASPSWVAGWYASPVHVVPGFANRTYRSVITMHATGRQVRVRLTNALGKSPVHVDAMTVGRAASLGSVTSVRPVRFHGKPGVTVPAGRDVFSDPVVMAVAGNEQIAVSFFAAGSTGDLTAHTSEPQGAGGPPSEPLPIGALSESNLSFLSVPGDHTADEAGTQFVQPDSTTALVDGIDVMPSVPTSAIVALGDSITDGFGSTPTTDESWPDQLSRRLLEARLPVTLVNAGISGGQVVGASGRGPSAIARLSRDVFSQSGVRAVILLEGINDIGAHATADQVIAGYRTILKGAHARGIKVYGGLLTPSGDLTRPFPSSSYSFPAAVAARHAVNAWMVKSHAFDGIIDFESAVQDATFPNHWKTGYSADDLHGNDAGYALMAGAVRLPMLAPGGGCR